MVVDEASSFDDAPPSEPDPFNATTYDSNQNLIQQANNVKVDTTSFPRPVPILGPLFGFTQANSWKAAQRNIQEAARRMHRVPTQEEADALAYHAYNATSIASYGRPLGVAGGIYRLRSTAKDWRFPFVKPVEGFNPEIVMIRGREVLKGQMARTFWRSSRAAAYISCGWLFGVLIAGSHAATIAAVGELRDPRLKNYVEMLREEARNEANRVKPINQSQGSTPPQQRRPNDPTGQGQTNVSDLWKNHRRDIGAPETTQRNRQQADFDDASPTGGMGLDDYVYSPGIDGGSTSSSNDYTDDRIPSSRSGSASSQTRPNQRSPPQPVRSRPLENQSSYDPYEEGLPSTQGQATQSSGGFSAWDRIRAGANAGSAPAQQSSSRLPQRRSPDESYSFSNEEEDKYLAKDEAQRDFEARLDRERRGGDFGGR